MESFVAANPAIAVWSGGILLSFIGVLIAAIVLFVKQYLNDISTTIKSFNSGLEIIKEDLGIIKDRLQRQETICEMQRKLCPYYHQALQSGSNQAVPCTSPVLIPE